MNATHTFRAVWPIVDQTVTWAALIAEARSTLPTLTSQAKARIDAKAGAFRIAPSIEIPGSGNLAATVLIFEAPATPAKARPYHRSPA